jgi:hypothetical protein
MIGFSNVRVSLAHFAAKSRQTFHSKQAFLLKTQVSPSFEVSE